MRHTVAPPVARIAPTTPADEPRASRPCCRASGSTPAVPAQHRRRRHCSRPEGRNSRPPWCSGVPPLRCCHCLPAPCQRPEHRTTQTRSPTAPSTPMLRVVRRIARCRSMTEAGRGPYRTVSFEMLPIQLPIVPVNLLSRSRLRSTSKRLRNAGRRGQSPQGRIRRMREKRNSQIHEVGEPAELRRKRSFQIIAGKRPITADVGSHRCVGAAGRSRSAPAIAEHNPRPDHPSSVRWLRCVGGSASAVRSGLGGADRVCQRMILRARRAPVPLPSTPHCVRHVGVAPVAQVAAEHARRRAACFPPMLPRIG